MSYKIQHATAHLAAIVAKVLHPSKKIRVMSLACDAMQG